MKKERYDNQNKEDAKAQKRISSLLRNAIKNLKKPVDIGGIKEVYIDAKP